MSKIPIRKIAFAGITAALYAALTIALSWISYGPIQFRIAEVLCVMPFFFPMTAPGLFVGCIIANILSPYGLLDLAAGSAATLIAALLTMLTGRIKKEGAAIKALACLPPVIVNALAIGAVIAFETTGSGDVFMLAFIVNGFLVGVGQLAVLYCIGLPVLIYLPKTRLFKFLSDQY